MARRAPAAPLFREGFVPVHLNFKQAVKLIKLAGPNDDFLRQLRSPATYLLTMQHTVHMQEAEALAAQKAALNPPEDLDWTRLKAEMKNTAVRERWVSSSVATTSVTLRSRDSTAYAKNVIIWAIRKMRDPTSYCTSANRTLTKYMIRKNSHELAVQQRSLAEQQRALAEVAYNNAVQQVAAAANESDAARQEAAAATAAARLAVEQAEAEAQRLRQLEEATAAQLQEELRKNLELEERMQALLSDAERNEQALIDAEEERQRQMDQAFRVKQETDQRLATAQQTIAAATQNVMMMGMQQIQAMMQALGNIAAHHNQYVQQDGQHRLREEQAAAGLEGMPGALPAAAPIDFMAHAQMQLMLQGPAFNTVADEDNDMMTE